MNYLELGLTRFRIKELEGEVISDLLCTDRQVRGNTDLLTFRCVYWIQKSEVRWVHCAHVIGDSVIAFDATLTHACHNTIDRDNVQRIVLVRVSREFRLGEEGIGDISERGRRQGKDYVRFAIHRNCHTLLYRWNGRGYSFSDKVI